MGFDHLILMLTENCPLQCAHCCVESGPMKQTTMLLDDALSYVRQAHAINPRTVISFTGGEPFARYPFMRSLAAEAHQLGMDSTVVTSAVWCKSPAFAQERLGELHALGLRTLSISYDSFHEPWTTPEHVRICAEAGLALGLEVVIHGSVTKRAPGAGTLLTDLLADHPELATHDFPVAPNGRGALIPLEDLLDEPWRDRPTVCPSPRDLLIRADGATYPCCSTGGDYAYLYLGDARETPLAELRRRAERPAWFRLITTEGFAALEVTLRRYDPELRFPDRAVGECHLCQLVFGAGELGERVRAALARHEQAEAGASQGLWAQIQATLSAASR